MFKFRIKRKMDRNLALQILAELFLIKDIDRLDKDIDYTQLTKSRARLVKNEFAINRGRTLAIARGNYEYALSVLSKYGTPDMVNKFRADNESTFRTSIIDILASRFYIDTDRDALRNYVTKNERDSTWFEFETIQFDGRDYYVAYN